jgi:Domain of unknown function (DUF4157)
MKAAAHSPATAARRTTAAPVPGTARAAAPAATAPTRLRCVCGGGCPGCVQTKLKLDTPGDAWEREADRAADALLAGRTAGALQAAPAVATQRLASHESPAPEDAEREEEEGSPDSVQRLAAAGDAQPTPAWAGQLRGAGSGQVLPTSIARDFGPRLGIDLAPVRVHADAHAAALCDGIGARAFTHGSHVFFNRGEYRPAERSGQRALAHELAHVVQQQGGAAGHVQRLPALNQSSPDTVTATQVHPWSEQPPVGDNHKLETDAGSPLSAWVAYGGQPVADRYWCHGHSLGTFAQWGYSVYSGSPMGNVIHDEYQRVSDDQASAGDLAVWVTMPNGRGFGHSARITRPVVAGGSLDPVQTQLSSKNGRNALTNMSLQAVIDVGYGPGVGVFRRR